MLSPPFSWKSIGHIIRIEPCQRQSRRVDDHDSISKETKKPQPNERRNLARVPTSSSPSPCHVYVNTFKSQPFFHPLFRPNPLLLSSHLEARSKRKQPNENGKNEYIQRETTSYLYLHFKTKQEQDPITSKHFEMIVGCEDKKKVKENCPRL